jgi:YVTN family beta-propeller protein
MEFRLLGPLEVEDDGRLLRLGSAKQRTLLAILLLHANEVVSRDRLIDELWGERPPASALHSLEVYVSRLRKTLQANGGEPLLVTRPGGYLIRVEPDQLDVARFERLVEQGRRALAAGNYARAAERLVEALALWRGPALGELAYEPFGRLEGERLEEQRVAALEERFDAELALGRHAALVAELETLTHGHPLRERLHGQLMLALYRSGRQAEALDIYRELRRHLRDELGLDPRPELQQLEQAILRQDPVLELRAPAHVDSAPRLLERTARARRLPSVAKWRPVFRVVAVAGLVLASVAAVVVLVTGRSGHSLGHVDANAVGAFDPATGKISAEVLLEGAAPAQVAAGSGSLWVVSPSSETVSRIDPATEHVVQTIDVGGGPSGIAYGGRAVWVANSLDGTVSRIDPGTNRVVATIPIGNIPTAVAAGFGSIWITNAGDLSVTRLDARTGRPLKTIPTGDVGRGIAVGPDAVWVSDDATGRVSRIDPRTNEVTDRVTAGSGASALAFGSGALWVANRLAGTVSRIDPHAAVEARVVPVGGAPSGMAIARGRVWVSDETGGRIVAIDPRRNDVVDTVTTGNRPLAITPAGGRMWAAVQAAPGAHRGGTLRVVWGFELDSLDPARCYSSECGRILITTNDGLTAFKKAGGVDGTELVPDLATALPAARDGGRTYVFHLRRGIRYSNGRFVRPADVRYALERDFALRSPGGTALYNGIRGAAECIRTPGRCDLSAGVVADETANTITFRLVAPDPEFPEKLAHTAGSVIPVGTPKRETIVPATGPYVIASYAPTRQLELQRNPRFHEWSAAAQPTGYPDEILWNYIGSADRQVTDVERGAADWAAGGLPAGRLPELRTQYASQLRSSYTPATQFLFMNTRVRPFDDIRVRRALNYAVDRRAVVRVVGGPDLAQPTCQVLPPSFPGYRRYCPYTLHPGADGTWHRPDLAKARRLITASGTRGMRITVWTIPYYARTVRYAVSLLRELGYRATLRLAASTTYVAIVGNSRARAQIGWAAWGADYPRPSNFLLQLTCRSFRPHSRANTNWAEFCDPKIDAEVKDAVSEQLTDPRAANERWASIDRDIVDEAPWVFLYTPKVTDLLSKRTGNYQANPQLGLLLDQLRVR